MKILIVEDDDDSRFLLTMLLERTGYSVVKASDGAEAWEKVNCSKPDLIVTDIFMPRMDGFSLCRKIKDDPRFRQIPLIFITATYVSKEDERLALSLGGARFLVKSQDPEVLLNSIRQVIKEYGEGKIHSIKQDPAVLDEMHKCVLSDKLDEKVRDLEKTNHILNETNEELRDYFHIISNDFQEPLRKISIFSHRLNEQSQDLNEQGTYYLDRLQFSVERMEEFLEDLLKYSKVVPLQNKPIQSVNLEDVIQNVLIDLEVLLNETKGKVEIESISIIQADPFQMRELFQILISNSLKYHKLGIPPKIKINGQISTSQSELYEIKVQDNGVGFDEKYKSQIFKSCARLHREGEYIGMGMGLSICKKIIERHGGSIEIKSKLNEGTTLIIKLPQKQP